MPPEPITPRRPRADAERNRRRLLDAASQVFAEQGPSATLGDVARAAGVGIGTVYRNVEDKDSLLDALFDDKIDTVMAVVETAARLDDPGEAFRSYLAGMLEVHALDRSLATVMFGPHRQGRFPSDLAERLERTADALIHRAIEAGDLRPGFTRQDTTLLAVMISSIAQATRELDPDLWRRCAVLVVDGTHPRASATALPGSVPDFMSVAGSVGRML